MVESDGEVNKSTVTIPKRVKLLSQWHLGNMNLNKLYWKKDGYFLTDEGLVMRK